jgi:hypothetical protein
MARQLTLVEEIEYALRIAQLAHHDIRAGGFGSGAQVPKPIVLRGAWSGRDPVLQQALYRPLCS